MSPLTRVAALALPCLAAGACGGVVLIGEGEDDAGAASDVATSPRPPTDNGGRGGEGNALSAGDGPASPSSGGAPPSALTGGVTAVPATGGVDGTPAQGGASPTCVDGGERVTSQGDCYAHGGCEPRPEGGFCTWGRGARLCDRAVTTGSPTLVDDLEDGDGLILPNDGRNGGWFAANDGTGEQFPAGSVPGECADEWGFTTTDGQACTHGSGFTSWGGEIGLTLRASALGCVSCSYDISAFTGVRFTLHATPGIVVRFEVGLLSTVTQQFGGSCVEDGTCWDDYGVDIAPGGDPITLSVGFDDLAQRGWGRQVPWTPEQAWTLRWVVNGPDFDFCVDDVEFF